MYFFGGVKKNLNYFFEEKKKKTFTHWAYLQIFGLHFLSDGVTQVVLYFFF